MNETPPSKNRNRVHKEIEATEADAPAALLAAVRRGVRNALRQHKLLGNPVVVWENGKIVWIPPEEIEV